MKPKFAGALVLAATLTLGSANAALADRPGTPNFEKAEVIGPHKIRISWNDTAHTRSFSMDGGGPNVIFEVEGGKPEATGCVALADKLKIQDAAAFCRTDPSSGYLRLGAYDPDHRLHWDVGGLQAGRSHCFRIWSRSPDDDLRSDQPSAFACATLPRDGPVNTQRPMAVSQIAPMHGQILWLRSDNNGVMTIKSDGFIMAVTPGHNCPTPWKDVTYQNGGFPGLGGSHERAAADAYWLCWSSLLPGNARVTPAPIAPQPAPRVDR